MVIGEDFVWAHFPKTGGDSTHELFRLVGIASAIDDTTRNMKHDSFTHREQSSGLDLTHTRRRIMNIRRLPAWLISHAKHHERGNGHPVDLRILRDGKYISLSGVQWARPLADRIARRIVGAENPRFLKLRTWLTGRLTRVRARNYADYNLVRMMCGRIDHWIRQEYLVDDFVQVMSQFVDFSPEQSSALRAMPRRNAGDYERDLASWFSRDDLARVYANNPQWTRIEREIYGHTLIDLDGAVAA